MKWYHRWGDRLGLAGRPRIRKLIVAVVGSTVILFGLALVVLPGPAVIVVPLGLAILATEFVWARRLVRHGSVLWGRARRWRQRRRDGSLGDDVV